MCVRGMRNVTGVHIKARRNVTLICNRFCGWLIAAPLLSEISSHGKGPVLLLRTERPVGETMMVMQINVGCCGG